MSTLNQFYREDSGTNTVLSIAEFMHTSSGTPASGLGSKILLGAENSTGTATSGAEIQGYLSTVTAAAEQGVFLLQLRNAGTLQDALQITAGTNSATFASNQTTVTAWNTTTTTLNIAGACTTIDFGYLTGTKTLRFSRGATTASDLFLWDWSVAGTVRWRWRFQGQETGSNAGSSVTLQAFSDAGAYISDIFQLYRATGVGMQFLRPVLLSTGSGLTTDQTTIAIVNTTATTVNFAGAATAINMGAGAATTITLSATTAVALNTAAITSNQTTVAVINTTATTVNAFGAASVALNIGNASAPATFAGGIAIADAKDIALNTTTGTKLGTATTQKIGLWNVTPVVQPSSTGEATGYTGAGGTALTHTDTFTGNNGTKAYTINDIVKHLKAVGIVAAS